ncbi:Transaldolase [Geitlerinema sp. FC II]|nr:Transaldolase [Geitlerinema sp. FC II]
MNSEDSHQSPVTSRQSPVTREDSKQITVSPLLPFSPSPSLPLSLAPNALLVTHNFFCANLNLEARRFSLWGDC